MILGIDFDNTLACYDGLFHAEALQRGMISIDVPTHKQGVRDALRTQGREEDFTLLQGYIYGPGLERALVYPGAKQCIQALRQRGVTVYIISHKTPFPYLGPKYNLHDAARDWLHAQGFYTQCHIAQSNVFLEHTKEDKIQRIIDLECTHFVDDLPEFLGHAAFPVHVEPLLFVPNTMDTPQHSCHSFRTFSTWLDVSQYLLATLGK